MVTDSPVHSGLEPGCDNIHEGDRVAFAEDLVTCADCLRLWREHGLPKYLVRHGETNDQFLRRTGQR